MSIDKEFRRHGESAKAVVVMWLTSRATSYLSCCCGYRASMRAIAVLRQRMRFCLRTAAQTCRSHRAHALWQLMFANGSVRVLWQRIRFCLRTAASYLSLFISATELNGESANAVAWPPWRNCQRISATELTYSLLYRLRQSTKSFVAMATAPLLWLATRRTGSKFTNTL